MPDKPGGRGASDEVKNMEQAELRPRKRLGAGVTGERQSPSWLAHGMFLVGARDGHGRLLFLITILFSRKHGEGFFRWVHLSRSHESHYKVSLQGIIIMKVNARSHCKESLQGVIARSHCKESLQGVIARSQC